MNLRDLPDMTAALDEVKGYSKGGKVDVKKTGKVEVQKEAKKKEPRWQDDDCDGKWYEKSDTDGKISKREKKEKKKHYEKEAFAFSDEEFEELAQLGEEIDAMSDEELVDLMIESIHEISEDDQDLIEICEHLEETEVLTEAPSKHSAMPNVAVQAPKKAPERDAGAEARKKLLSKKKSPSRMERLKSAAKKAGSLVKKGVKAVGKKAVQTAGKVAGEFSASKEKQKSSSMEKEPKETPKKSSGVTRSTVPSSTRSAGGGGSSSGGGSSESGGTRKAVGGALRKVGSLLKKGVKKAVGKTSRLVSKGSDKLAKRLGEEYDEIASLYESGLFTIEEIENIVEEKKPLPKNKMFRKAGNLGREVVSPSVTDDQRQKAYDRSKKIVKTLNKENQK